MRLPPVCTDWTATSSILDKAPSPTACLLGSARASTEQRLSSAQLDVLPHLMDGEDVKVKHPYLRSGPHERTRGNNYGQRPPARGPRPGVPQPEPQPTALAEALWTKNLRVLSEVGGEENLALLLDMPLPRIKQLLEGKNFSEETAFHIEMMLGLSGFLEKLNPQLPPRAGPAS